MSYTQHTATAVCRYNDALDPVSFCSGLYEYSREANDAPESLADCDTVISFSGLICDYVELVGGELTIKFDTEEINSDNEIFDYVSNYAMSRMSGPFMKITWVSYDSKDGLSADCTYYDKRNSFINVEDLICKLHNF